jgi:hypothetical protein
LVIYHNRWADVRGWIKTSAAYKDKARHHEQLYQTDLGDALGLENAEDTYLVFRDSVTGLEYIRSNRSIFNHGLYIELGAYKYHVFMDFREVKDNEWRQYARLFETLKGRGVISIEETFTEIILRQIRDPYQTLIAADSWARLIEHRLQPDRSSIEILNPLLEEIEGKAEYFFHQVGVFTGTDFDEKSLVQDMTMALRAILSLPYILAASHLPGSRNFAAASRQVLIGEDRYGSLQDGSFEGWGVLLGWAFTRNLGKVIGEESYEALSRKLFDDWLLGKLIAESLTEVGVSQALIVDSLNLIKGLIKHQNWSLQQIPQKSRTARILASWLDDQDIQQYLKINQFSGIYWFNSEAMESLLRWMLTIGILSIYLKHISLRPDEVPAKEIADLFSVIKAIKKSAAASEYKVEKLLKGV